MSHGADKTGPMAGVKYDGIDPHYADLYHDAGCEPFIDKLTWNDDGIPDSWRQHYLNRMTDLIDKYHPDLLYTDGHLPFEEYGLKMVSHLYNESARLNGGEVEAVYTSKEASDCAVGTCLLDHERGVADGIAENPWQTDTCIGQWHYKRGQKYKTAEKSHRFAHRHREQKRQPAAEFSAAQLGPTGLRGDGSARGHHRVDAD